MFPTILIVDDEPSILQSLSGLLEDEGYEVITASNGYEALKLIESEMPDLVLLDIWMPGIDGIETLKEIKKDSPSVQVVIITGHGTIETAVKATKLGAFDLIEKPLSIDKVIVTINNALNFRRLEEENKYLRKKTIEKNAINGNSPPIQELRKAIASVAPTDSWILITGENGTGKELVARTIHQLSPRAENPLIDVNCAAVPAGEIEAELFGRGREAGPDRRRRGKLEMANTGTLFLDEIADMSLEVQAKLLRVLQEQRFQRMGGGRTLAVNARVIAATNRDLEAEISKGAFREDLYYRLNVVPLRVPPLRERAADIPALVDTFLDEYAKRNRTPPRRISPEVIEMLSGYPWPGNVRELKNLVGRLSILAEGEVIRVTDLRAPYNPSTAAPAPAAQDRFFDTDRLDTALSRFETAFIQKKLAQENNDIHQTAARIGLPVEELRKRLSTSSTQSTTPHPPPSAPNPAKGRR